MRKHPFFVSLLAIFVFGAAAAESQVSAQIAGGYGRLSVKSKDARDAAAFAIKAQSKVEEKKFILVKVLKAEVQVVAGLNHRICMLVRQGKSRSKSVTAVVYKDLKNVRSLTTWEGGGCKEL